jgi:hypothetical protein
LFFSTNIIDSSSISPLSCLCLLTWNAQVPIYLYSFTSWEYIVTVSICMDIIWDSVKCVSLSPKLQMLPPAWKTVSWFLYWRIQGWNYITMPITAKNVKLLMADFSTIFCLQTNRQFQLLIYVCRGWWEVRYHIADYAEKF